MRLGGECGGCDDVLPQVADQILSKGMQPRRIKKHDINVENHSEATITTKTLETPDKSSFKTLRQENEVPLARPCGPALPR